MRHRAALVPAVLAGILGAGPSLGAQSVSPAQTPQMPPPAIAPRVGVAGPPLTLTLDEAIRRALEQNTDVEISRVDTLISAETIRVARGAYDPRVVPSLSFLHATNASASALGGATRGSVEQRQLIGGVSFLGAVPAGGGRFSLDFESSRLTTSNQISRLNPQFPSAFGLSYTQPLLRNRSYDANRRALEIAQRAFDLSEAELRQTVMDQLMLVEQAYWELVYAVRFLDIQISALAQAEGQVASNERQAKGGTLAPIDVVEAQTQVSSFRQGVASAQQALTEAENRLKRLMLTRRESPEWNQPISPADPAVDRAAPSYAVEAAVTVALAQRPELAALESVRLQNDADRRFFRDQTRPQVDVTGGVTFSGLAGGVLQNTDETIPEFLIGGYGTSLGNLFARRFPAALVQFQVELPVRNTTARANLARAELSNTQLALRRQQLELAIEADVRNALQAERSARERLAAAASASRNAQEQYESERRRFDSGLSTVFLVLERQNNLVAAQGRELRARADLNQALALLDRAVGGTLERHGVKLGEKK